MNPFSNLGLDSWILRLCERVNYSRPTNIQKLAIPSIIKGEHVIGIKASNEIFNINNTISKC